MALKTADLTDARKDRCLRWKPGFPRFASQPEQTSCEMRSDGSKLLSGRPHKSDSSRQAARARGRSRMAETA